MVVSLVTNTRWVARRIVPHFISSHPLPLWSLSLPLFLPRGATKAENLGNDFTEATAKVKEVQKAKIPPGFGWNRTMATAREVFVSKVASLFFSGLNS